MPYCIVIADDATMNRLLIKNILSAALPDVVFEEALNGQEVLDIVARVSVDLIMLDLVMPVMDGYTALRALKSDARYQDIPVIVNSAITEIKSIEDTLKVGAVDYFTKPLSPNDMKIILPLKVNNALHMYEQNKTIAALNHQINEELKNANTFANILLPQAKSLKTAELYMTYYPSLGIGGDFFDCFEENGKIHFMVADVTGHGIAAGMASSMVKILYRKSIEKNAITPHEILEDMNASIFRMFDFAGRDNYFVFTAFVGIIEDGILTYANAGQPYPMIYRYETDVYDVIEQNGFIMGMMEDISFETGQTYLSKGDVIFLYTDGLFCTGKGNDFTAWTKVFELANRLKDSLRKDPDDFLEMLFYGFKMMHHSKGLDFTDDVAMMCIKPV